MIYHKAFVLKNLYLLLTIRNQHKYLNNLWETEVSKEVNNTNIKELLIEQGNILQNDLGVPVDIPLAPTQSEMFKKSYTNTDRTGQGFIDIE